MAGPSLVAIEMSVIGRSPSSRSEDAVGANSSFAWVVDGATDKGGELWNGVTAGAHAAQVLVAAIPLLSGDATVEDATRALTVALADSHETEGRRARLADQPVLRPAASVAIYSAARDELWLIGDCHALFIGQPGTQEVAVQNHRATDRIAAEARAAFLETELATGATVSELRRSDTGRAFILELLRRQSRFQNQTRASPYNYAVIDGFPVDAGGIKVASRPPGAVQVVLASDGYPILLPTLDATEKYLADLVAADPLMIGKHKATKGVAMGATSFDDRSYVRVQLGTQGQLQ